MTSSPAGDLAPQHVLRFPVLVLTPGRARVLAELVKIGRERARSNCDYLQPFVVALFEELEDVDREARANRPASILPGNQPVEGGSPDTLEVMSSQEAANVIGVSSKRVRQLAAEGTLAGELTPTGWAFTPTDVEAYADSRAAR